MSNVPGGVTSPDCAGLYALTVSSSREIISDVLPSTRLPPVDPGGHIGTRLPTFASASASW
jgi:hypothetical protein